MAHTEYCFHRKYISVCYTNKGNSLNENTFTGEEKSLLRICGWMFIILVSRNEIAFVITILL